MIQFLTVLVLMVITLQAGAQFTGGIGRGDDMDLVTAGGLVSTDVVYFGGTGRGDIASAVFSGGILPCTNPTDGGTIAEAQTICYGDDPAAFTSIAPASGHTGTLEYQWQMNTVSPTASFDDWDNVGTNTDTYDHVGMLTQTTWFRRLAKVDCVTGTFETNSASSNVLEINVDPLPTATAGGSAMICEIGSHQVIGASATNGTILWTHNGEGSLDNAGTLTPTYNATAGDTGNTVTLTMTVTSNNACVPATATAQYTIIVNQCTPDDIDLPYTIVDDGDTLCFGAKNTIVVQNGLEVYGGSITLIARESIHLLPGVIVQGGHLHAYISNTLCENPENLLKSVVTDAMISGKDKLEESFESFFKIYPNPTTGSFTLELTSNDDDAVIVVEIYSLVGTKLMSSKLHGSYKCDFHLESYASGIYLIRVFSGTKADFFKVVKQ